MKRTPLRRKKPMKRTATACITASPAGIFPAAETPASPRKPISPVSLRRARENRVRKALVREVFPEPPFCAVPWCLLMADDVHETLTRARSGGDITNPDIWAPACREHNGELTTEPRWGYSLGLLHHSWDDPGEDPPGSLTREAAALLFARDPWCIHCGSPRTLRPWLRQEYGEHQGCSCGWVLLCPRCQGKAATDRTGEMHAEGFTIRDPGVMPYYIPVTVHLEDDRGGMLQYPSCAGKWLSTAISGRPA